ncbi:hypothetical protein [Actinocorallia sp. A-T 12471]|uniref:hypothetical protein n=1 Tax=Actinocorallia sp. A-T 12471 TaxID=3089813 RepID=UPI0029CAC90D|nr:hypothetical protein [Actinocorallia sp. A-T 12471]MDX6742327.1 hypothetical protein [Actinocorallia sp. A-T 12471]
MSDVGKAPLAGYQERRLAELRAVVEARAAEGSARRRFTRRRPVWAVAVAACALGAAVVVLPEGAPPAYAVTREPSGLVTVKVTERVLDTRDAAALSDELARLGVPGFVFSLPERTVCAQPHAELVDLPANVYEMPDGLYTVPRNLPGEDGGWQITINPAHFRPGQVLVWTLTTSGIFNPRGQRVGSATSTGTYLTTGRVIPCAPRPVPSDHPAGSTGGYIEFGPSS